MNQVDERLPMSYVGPKGSLVRSNYGRVKLIESNDDLSRQTSMTDENIGTLRRVEIPARHRICSLAGERTPACHDAQPNSIPDLQPGSPLDVVTRVYRSKNRILS